MEAEDATTRHSLISCSVGERGHWEWPREPVCPREWWHDPTSPPGAKREEGVGLAHAAFAASPAAAMEGSGIQEEDFVDYESAIKAIPEGATEVSLRGARLSEDVVKDLAAALTSVNDKVAWRFADAREIVDEDNAEVVQFAKVNDEDAENVRCGYVKTVLANVTSVKVWVR
ncbi:unnamed protein product, partial [Prorocentrum cordatum]